MLQQLLPAFRITLLFTILTGVIYPVGITGLCQLLFPRQANGSLVTASNGQVIGSSLLGQNFTKPEYFHPRPSNSTYDATNSGGSNFGPTNKKLVDRVKADTEAFRRDNPDFTGPIPSDMLTASGSGLDPDISRASADAQVSRVAHARGTDVSKVQDLIARHAEGRTLGLLGEVRVNVLELNRALDEESPLKK